MRGDKFPLPEVTFTSKDPKIVALPCCYKTGDTANFWMDTMDPQRQILSHNFGSMHFRHIYCIREEPVTLPISMVQNGVQCIYCITILDRREEPHLFVEIILDWIQHKTKALPYLWTSARASNTNSYIDLSIGSKNEPSWLCVRVLPRQ